jgi:molybdopterin-guanine dinucleotide biosynthesis protein A
VPRLWEALLTAEADIAMAAAPEIGLDGSSSIRAQPVFCLLRVSLLESLVSFTHQGGRKIDAWTGQHKTALAIFDRPGDDPQAFFNTNTLGELHALERRPT